MAASKTLTPEQRTARARIAALTRSRPADDPELLAARRRLLELTPDDQAPEVQATRAQQRAEQLEAITAAHIKALVDAAPPLTDTQKDQLRTLLGGGR